MYILYIYISYIYKFTVNCNDCCHVNAINLLYEGVNKMLRDSSVQFFKMFSGNSDMKWSNNLSVLKRNSKVAIYK